MAVTTQETKGGSSDVLTERMRAEVHNEHEKSNRLVNLKLALVLTSAPLYGESISLFLPVFEKIEEILDRNSNHPQLGKLSPLLDNLRRGPGFRADMEYYLTTDRRRELEGSWKRKEHPEVAQYLERLEFLEQHDPIRILTYVYHMYAALLTGGQIVRRMVVKALGLKGTGDNNDPWDGVAAFRIKRGLTISPKELAHRLKKIMNEDMELSEEEQVRIIQEGKEVFRLNDALIGSVKDTKAWQQAANACIKKTMLPLGCVCLLLAWFYFSRKPLSVQS